MEATREINRSQQILAIAGEAVSPKGRQKTSYLRRSTSPSDYFSTPTRLGLKPPSLANFLKRGAKVHLLRRIKKYIAENESCNELWTTAETCEFLIKRWTAKDRCSFEDMMIKRHTDIPHPELGLTYDECFSSGPTVFVSHAWCSELVETISALETFSRDRTESMERAESVNIHLPNGTKHVGTIHNRARDTEVSETTFWMDLFFIDQWATENKTSDWLSIYLLSAIREIGHTVVVLSNWNEFLPLLRSWCLWEMYCTVGTNTQLTLQLSDFNRKILKSRLAENFAMMAELISDVKVQSSEATSDAEREVILSAFEGSSDGGIETANNRLGSWLHEWLEELLHRPDNVPLLHLLCDPSMTSLDEPSGTISASDADNESGPGPWEYSYELKEACDSSNREPFGRSNSEIFDDLDLVGAQANGRTSESKRRSHRRSDKIVRDDENKLEGKGMRRGHDSSGQLSLDDFNVSLASVSNDFDYSDAFLGCDTNFSGSRPDSRDGRLEEHITIVEVSDDVINSGRKKKTAKRRDLRHGTHERTDSGLLKDHIGALQRSHSSHSSLDSLAHEAPFNHLGFRPVSVPGVEKTSIWADIIAKIQCGRSIRDDGKYHSGSVFAMLRDEQEEARSVFSAAGDDFDAANSVYKYSNASASRSTSNLSEDVVTTGSYSTLLLKSSRTLAEDIVGNEDTEYRPPPLQISTASTNRVNNDRIQQVGASGIDPAHNAVDTDAEEVAGDSATLAAGTLEESGCCMRCLPLSAFECLAASLGNIKRSISNSLRRRRASMRRGGARRYGADVNTPAVDFDSEIAAAAQDLVDKYSDSSLGKLQDVSQFSELQPNSSAKLSQAGRSGKSSQGMDLIEVAEQEILALKEAGEGESRNTKNDKSKKTVMFDDSVEIIGDAVYLDETDEEEEDRGTEDPTGDDGEEQSGALGLQRIRLKHKQLEQNEGAVLRRDTEGGNNLKNCSSYIDGDEGDESGECGGRDSDVDVEQPAEDQVARGSRQFSSAGDSISANVLSRAEKKDLLIRMGEMSDRAMEFRDTGDLQAAEDILYRALELGEEYLGSGDPAILAMATDLAHVTYSEGKLEQSEVLFERVVCGYEALYGFDSKHTLRAASNLANLLRQVGRREEAKALYDKTLEGMYNVMGPASAETLAVLEGIAVLLMEEEQPLDAICAYNLALEGFENIYGERHLTTLTAVATIGEWYVAVDRVLQAISYTRRAVLGFAELLGENHSATLASLHSLAKMYSMNSQCDQAELIYQLCLSVRDRAMGPNDPDTLATAFDYAMMLQSLNRVAEARMLLKNVVDGCRAVYGEDREETNMAEEALHALSVLHATSSSSSSIHNRL